MDHGSIHQSFTSLPFSSQRLVNSSSSILSLDSSILVSGASIIQCECCYFTQEIDEAINSRLFKEAVLRRLSLTPRGLIMDRFLLLIHEMKASVNRICDGSIHHRTHLLAIPRRRFLHPFRLRDTVHGQEDSVESWLALSFLSSFNSQLSNAFIECEDGRIRFFLGRLLHSNEYE